MSSDAPNHVASDDNDDREWDKNADASELRLEADVDVSCIAGVFSSTDDEGRWRECRSVSLNTFLCVGRGGGGYMIVFGGGGGGGGDATASNRGGGGRKSLSFASL